jgi:hypothetical protein
MKRPMITFLTQLLLAIRRVISDKVFGRHNRTTDIASGAKSVTVQSLTR